MGPSSRSLTCCQWAPDIISPGLLGSCSHEEQDPFLCVHLILHQAENPSLFWQCSSLEAASIHTVPHKNCFSSELLAWNKVRFSCVMSLLHHWLYENAHTHFTPWSLEEICFKHLLFKVKPLFESTSFDWHYVKQGQVHVEFLCLMMRHMFGEKPSWGEITVAGSGYSLEPWLVSMSGPDYLTVQVTEPFLNLIEADPIISKHVWYSGFKIWIIISVLSEWSHSEASKRDRETGAADGAAKQR